MLSKIIRSIGLITIVLFSGISIFFAIEGRDLGDNSINSFFSYTSFFEDRFYDLRMRRTLDSQQKENRILLAAIDDTTIKKVGRWPFPRDTWAKLLNKLQTFEAKVVSFDVFFSEPSLSCGENSPDQKLAQAISLFQQDPVKKVILPYSISFNNIELDVFKETPDSLYNEMIDSKELVNAIPLQARYIEKRVFPIPALTETEAPLGYIEATADKDGIFRHYPLVAQTDGIYIPSFSLLSYKYLTGDIPLFETSPAGNFLKTKSGKLALNSKGETKIRWLGGVENFPVIPIWKILEASDDDLEMKKYFQDNIIFIGSTAFGAHDFRHTPVDSMLPGVFFHMNMLHMLLENNFYAPKEKTTRYSWIILILGTLLILLIQYFGNAIVDLLSVILIGFGLYFADTYYLIPKGLEITLFFCLFSILACYSWNTFLNFYMASKDKNFLKKAFSTYISPDLINEMYQLGEAPKLGGESGIRTAYFTDIQGFSTFSEKLSATQLVELLNEYLSTMTDILIEEKGTLDKYEGDAIIAFLGAPMPLHDHALRACTIAYRMQTALLELRKKWKSEGSKWPKIVHDMRMRIGINTGEMVTGNMGSQMRMNYTMMGDSVNLAARLEEAAKQYGIFTHVSESTMLMTGDAFLWRKIDSVQVFGKSEPVTSYELLDKKETAPKYLMELSSKFERAFSLYQSMKWDEAISLFKETLELEKKKDPDLDDSKNNPSKVFISRCENFKNNPPESDWDGVFKLTSK